EAPGFNNSCRAYEAKKSRFVSNAEGSYCKDLRGVVCDLLPLEHYRTRSRAKKTEGRVQNNDWQLSTKLFLVVEIMAVVLSCIVWAITVMRVVIAGASVRFLIVVGVRIIEIVWIVSAVVVISVAIHRLIYLLLTNPIRVEIVGTGNSSI